MISIDKVIGFKMNVYIEREASAKEAQTDTQAGGA
jgi:hypothetical protein